VLLVGSLGGSHPLKCSTLISGCDLDFHVDGFAFGYLGRKGNGKRAAIRLHAITNVELDALTLDLYDGNVKEAICS
jgi:hypothetical protein